MHFNFFSLIILPFFLLTNLSTLGFSQIRIDEYFKDSKNLQKMARVLLDSRLNSCRKDWQALKIASIERIEVISHGASFELYIIGRRFVNDAYFGSEDYTLQILADANDTASEVNDLQCGVVKGWAHTYGTDLDRYSMELAGAILDQSEACEEDWQLKFPRLNKIERYIDKSTVIFVLLGTSSYWNNETESESISLTLQIDQYISDPGYSQLYTETTCSVR